MALLLLYLIAALHGSCGDSVSWCKDCAPYGRYIPRGPDDYATELQLGVCGIKELEPDIFNGFPNLNEIWLDENLLTHVDPAVFIPVPNLTALYLEDNKLTEVPAFGDYAVMTRLRELFLQGNRITNITNPNTFSRFTKLELLILSSNRIEYIHPDVFKPLVSLERLLLSRNKLKIIPEGILQISSLEEVQLGHNLIEFVPIDAFRGSKLNYLNLSNNKLQHLAMNFATEVLKPGASFRKFYFYGNPWQCGCVLELLVEVRKAEILYILFDGSKFDGRKPECTFNGGLQCRRDVLKALSVDSEEDK